MGRRHFKPEQSYCRWRKEYGGMQVSQARKLKELVNCRARRQWTAFLSRWSFFPPVAK